MREVAGMFFDSLNNTYDSCSSVTLKKCKWSHSWASSIKFARNMYLINSCIFSYRRVFQNSVSLKKSLLMTFNSDSLLWITALICPTVRWHFYQTLNGMANSWMTIDPLGTSANWSQGVPFLSWLSISIWLSPFKVGTHEGTSPCDWSLRLVPCSVYTKEIVAGTSPLKK